MIGSAQAIADTAAAVRVAIDSTRVTGLLAPIAPHIWPAARPYVLGAAVWVTVDLFEVLIARMQRFPLFKQIYTVWSSDPRVVGPLLALAGAFIGTGNLLPGVIAAGMRSLIAKRNVFKVKGAPPATDS